MDLSLDHIISELSSAPPTVETGDVEPAVHGCRCLIADAITGRRVDGALEIPLGPGADDLFADGDAPFLRLPGGGEEKGLKIEKRNKSWTLSFMDGVARPRPRTWRRLEITCGDRHVADVVVTNGETSEDSDALLLSVGDSQRWVHLRRVLGGAPPVDRRKGRGSGHSIESKIEVLEVSADGCSVEVSHPAFSLESGEGWSRSVSLHPSWKGQVRFRVVVQELDLGLNRCVFRLRSGHGEDAIILARAFVTVIRAPLAEPQVNHRSHYSEGAVDGLSFWFANTSSGWLKIKVPVGCDAGWVAFGEKVLASPGVGDSMTDGTADGEMQSTRIPPNGIGWIRVAPQAGLDSSHSDRPWSASLSVGAGKETAGALVFTAEPIRRVAPFAGLSERQDRIGDEHDQVTLGPGR